MKKAGFIKKSAKNIVLNKKNLIKNPDKGGIPAKEKKINEKSIDKKKLYENKALQSKRDLPVSKPRKLPIPTKKENNNAVITIQTVK